MKTLYINQPMHPVTVLVIGAGGNGSQILQQLGRIDHALKKLGKPGLFVVAIDPDKVSDANIGRQLFTEYEVGEYKANVLISRLNRFYGLNWYAYPDRFHFDKKQKNDLRGFNVIITATDRVQSRIEVNEWVKKLSKSRSSSHEDAFHFWLDMGNSKTTGQVICGSPRYKIPTLVDMYPDIKKYEDKDNTPSCSLAEALDKQDMFINTYISNVAAKLLWEMLTKEEVNWRGAYVNLDTLNIKKIAA